MAGEKLFENKVKRFLKQFPDLIWFVKVWGGGFQKSGIPDLICCVNGVFITVELKASSGHASELQKYNTKLINQAGGIGIILYPEGFENFKKLILGVINCSSHIQGLNALKNALSSTKCVIWTK
jgi:hypothetical protein